MTNLDAWVVATGYVRDTGEVLHTHVDPLTVEFVQGFPHRVEIWTPEEHEVLGAGCLDDSGSFFAVDELRNPIDGMAVLVVVDLLGPTDGAEVAS